MKHLTLMMLCLCISLIPSLHSQSQQSLFLQYPSDVHALDDDQRSMLSDLLVKLESHADYNIEIIGHTDQDGTNEYNEVLAQKRAEEVNEHLLTMGVAEDLISCSWKGETALVEKDNSHSSKQKNRRVELRYNYRDFDKIDELIDAVTTNDGEQKFKSNNQEQTIDLEKGSSLYIPEGAFVHQDGSEVNGKIDVTVIEAYDLHDFVSHDLITECKDEILETGGMFYIGATAKGEELQLKGNKKIEMIYPVQDIKEGMEVFYGRGTPRGVVWDATGDVMRTTQVKNEPVQIDLSKIIDYIMEPMDKPKLEFSELPGKPRIGSKPMPPSDQIYTSKKYAEVYAKYEKKLKEYNDYLPTHEVKLAQWNAEVDKRIQMIEDYTKTQLEYKYHGRIYLAKKRLEKLGTRRAPMELLQGIFSFMKNPMRIYMEERKIYKKAFQNYAREIIKERNLEIKKEGHLVYPRSNFHPELRTLVFEARKAAMEEQFQNSGSIDRENFGSYVAGISKLGWINCDRFGTFGERVDVGITSPMAETRYYMIFKNIRSILRPSNKFHLKKWREVPVGEEVKLIAIQLVNEKPYMAVEDYVIQSGDNDIDFNFYPCDLSDIRQELNEVEMQDDEVSEELTLEVRAFPNPATTELSVEVSSPELLSDISLYDMGGNLVKSIQKDNLINKSNTISVSDCENGMYVVNANYSDGRSVSERVLVSH